MGHARSPVIDRIARFIDKDAEFLFVPPSDVIRTAEETGAVPYDVPGVKMTHVGEGCSFDAFVQKYGLGKDPAIRTVAAIVRGADTDRHDLTAQSAGLLAISMGLRDLSPDVPIQGRHDPDHRGLLDRRGRSISCGCDLMSILAAGLAAALLIAPKSGSARPIMFAAVTVGASVPI
jgi:hypothetical protein